MLSTGAASAILKLSVLLVRGFAAGIKNTLASVGVSVPGVTFSVAFKIVRCEWIIASIFFLMVFFCGCVLKTFSIF
jgi:hypothetical protein